MSTTNQGPVSVANGVVYAGAIDGAGTMYALNAANGSTLWTFASGGSVNAGAAIVNGTVYWGSDYGVPGFGVKSNNKLYAFVLGNGLPTDAGVPDAGVGTGAADAGVVDAGVVDSGKADSGVVDSGVADSSVADASSAATWTSLYNTYFGAGTAGHCVNCHSEASSPNGLYTFLQNAGQIAGVGSHFGEPGLSVLSWLGGGMPIGGASGFPQARADIQAWVAAGALDN